MANGGELHSQFVRDGFVFPVPVLSTSETRLYREKYAEYVKRYGTEQAASHQVGQGKSHRRIRGNKIFRLHILAGWAAKLVRHPNIIRAVSQAVGSSNILIWSSDLTVKPGLSSECFGWHQDEAYADLGPHEKLATAWIALTNSTEENGCVRFIQGSHRGGTLPHTSRLRTPDCNLVLGQVLADTNWMREWDNKSVSCVLSAGEASLHAWRTVHYSQPNTSQQDRIGLAVRYMAGEVRPSQPVVKERVSLAAGTYSGDWFELEPEPAGDFGRAEWAEHKLSMEREWERRRRSKELGLLPSHQFSQKSSTSSSSSSNNTSNSSSGDHASGRGDMARTGEEERLDIER